MKIKYTFLVPLSLSVILDLSLLLCLVELLINESSNHPLKTQCAAAI